MDSAHGDISQAIPFWDSWEEDVAEANANDELLNTDKGGKGGKGKGKSAENTGKGENKNKGKSKESTGKDKSKGKGKWELGKSTGKNKSKSKGKFGLGKSGKTKSLEGPYTDIVDRVYYIRRGSTKAGGNSRTHREYVDVTP